METVLKEYGVYDGNLEISESLRIKKISVIKLYCNEVTDLGFVTILFTTSVKGQYDVENCKNGNMMKNIFTLLIEQQVSRKFMTKVMASVIIFVGTRETLNQIPSSSIPFGILTIFRFP